MLSEVLFVLDSERGVLFFMSRRGVWCRLIDLDLPDYVWHFFRYLSGQWLPLLHTGIFHRNSLLLARCSLSDTPAVRGLCPFNKVSPPAAVAMLRMLLQERRCDWPCPFLLIRQMQVSLQSRTGGCSCQPAVLVTALFQLCVNPIFL